MVAVNYSIWLAGFLLDQARPRQGFRGHKPAVQHKLFKPHGFPAFSTNFPERLHYSAEVKITTLARDGPLWNPAAKPLILLP